MLLRVALLQSAFPKRQSQSKLRRWCFLSPVFKKAVILVYRENNKLKKKMVSIMSGALIYSHMLQIGSLVWNIAFFIFLYPCGILYVMTRPTLAQHFLTEIRTPSSSVGSSRSLRCRSDWEILQVRGRHTATLSPLNHSQSTSTKSFCSFSPFIFPHTPP